MTSNNKTVQHFWYMNESVERISRAKMTEEVFDKNTCPSDILPTTNPTWTGPPPTPERTPASAIASWATLWTPHAPTIPPTSPFIQSPTQTRSNHPCAYTPTSHLPTHPTIQPFTLVAIGLRRMKHSSINIYLGLHFDHTHTTHHIHTTLTPHTPHTHTPRTTHTAHTHTHHTYTTHTTHTPITHTTHKPHTHTTHHTPHSHTHSHTHSHHTHHTNPPQIPWPTFWPQTNMERTHHNEKETTRPQNQRDKMDNWEKIPHYR